MINLKTLTNITRAFAGGGILAIVGCSYPTVSGKTYDVSKALYSACNRQDESHLDKVANIIESAQGSSEITADEAGWLNEIIATARRGEWELAAAEARSILEDQIE